MPRRCSAATTRSSHWTAGSPSSISSACRKRQGTRSSSETQPASWGCDRRKRSPPPGAVIETGRGRLLSEDGLVDVERLPRRFLPGKALCPSPPGRAQAGGELVVVDDPLDGFGQPRHGPGVDGKGGLACHFRQ